MKVLFVDDEPRVLQALERALLIADVEWEAHFVEGGAAALSALERDRYDVVVTDMRMPGVDGAAVLAAARDRDPGTVRIVLSGQADEGSALQMVRVAHRFLAKPCEAKLLRQVVERTGALHRILTDEKLRALVGSVDRLPSALRIFQELSDLLAREDASTDKVTDLVRQDPAMATKLLQFVNSAFFAHSREISDIRNAVVRLGMKSVKNLVLGIGVFDTAVRWGLPASFSVDEMQQRAFTTARVAGEVVPDRPQADAAFMAGLVCDIGELVLAATQKERLAGAWASAGARQVSRVALERETFGVSHAEVGACLIGLWGLPFAVVEAVAHHHVPEQTEGSPPSLSAVVWLASTIARGEAPDGALVKTLGAEKVLERALAARP